MRTALIPIFLCSGCISPGFVGEDVAVDGPALSIRADVDNSDATLHIDVQSLGDVIGLSYHVMVDRAFVDVGRVDQPAFLGDVDARHLASTTGGDIALGGSRVSLDAGAVNVPDGELATITLRGVASGTSTVAIIDAVARRADTSLVPLTTAGGALTLEAKP